MLRSFLHVPPGSHFSLHNLPYGIFSTPDRGARMGVAIGDYILDLKAAHAAQLLAGPILSQSSCFQQVRSTLRKHCTLCVHLGIIQG